NPTYSSDFNMAFNLGGALADISWLDSADMPIVSFHCEKDPYAPLDTGDVIVPTTGDFVVEVMGSRTVQDYSNQYGNNDVFVNAGFTDIYTTSANVNNSGFEGLYIFKTPSPSTAPNAFGQSDEEQSSPWDWWDNPTYDYIFTLYNPTAPSGYGAASSILGNPDMSSTKGRTYIDTIQGYLNPRMYVALNLAGQNSVNNVVDFTTNIYPNPAKNNITIENSNFVISNIELYNITGQLVKTENVNSMSINMNISDLKTGIYILELHTNETSIRRKLIIE
ncbi:MAG: T9SS type A sorting domain-containing protein, partial [Flavobacteriales bacterium]